MVAEGFPSQPIILFLSGDDAVVVRRVDFIRKGKEMTRLYLHLPESVKSQYSIDPKTLNYDIPGYPDGVAVYEYNRTDIVILSNNPEKPRWLGFCHLFGYPVEAKSQSLFFIRNVLDEAEALRHENRCLRAEIRRLRDELFQLSSSVIKYKKRNASLYDVKEAVKIVSNLIERKKEET
ncbi:MAG: hypothetical protein QW469_01145 [Candidatus Aenigmatarchaeota archaeon]